MQNIRDKIINNNTSCYFVSPHLDDAVFSAGTLIKQLQKHVNVTVINVFTQIDNKPYTQSTKAFLNQCSFKSAQQLIDIRKAEDKKALKSLGTKIINLDFADALWRKNSGIIANSLGKYIGEFSNTYPTYRWHVIKGNISKQDEETMTMIANSIQKSILEKDNYIIFCPIGTGKHVDHIVVRDVCKNNFKKVIYWADYPYNLNNKLDTYFVEKNNLEKFTLTVNKEEKEQMIFMYESQAKAIFGTEKPKIINEDFYISPKVLQNGK